MPLTFDPVLELVDALNAAGVRASTDPADVNPPGAWVTVEGIQAVNLRGTVRVMAVVWLIVPDRDYRRALEALAALYNAIVPALLVPDGQVTPQGVVLPGDSTPLPALRVPVNLHESE